MFPATVVIYDILRDGIGWTPVLMSVVWLGIAVAVAVRLVREALKRRWFLPPGGLTFWFVFWLIGGSIGLGNVFTKHFQCRRWASTGDVQVVEGAVTQYQPEAGKKRESLTVAGRTFTYYTANLANGGYRGVPAAAPFIAVGKRVRVTFHDYRILKLEVIE